MIPEIDDMKKNLRSCKSCQQRYDVAFDVLVKDIFDPKKLTAEDTEMLDVAYKFPMISGGLQTGDDEDREGDVVDGDGVDSAIPFSAEQPPHLRLSKACLRRRPLKESCLDLIKYLNRKCNCIISKISVGQLLTWENFLTLLCRSRSNLSTMRYCMLSYVVLL